MKIETNILVKKILKYKGKILTIEQIKKILHNLGIVNYYKKIYFLKKRGYLITLKKKIFFIKDAEQEIDNDELIEKIYWQFLKKYVKDNFSNKYYIGGIKALEIRNNNYSIPEKIHIINPYKKNTETLLKGKKIFNTIYKIKTLDYEKSFKYFKKQTKEIIIENKKFNIANYELSILESLYSPNFIEEKYIFELVKKNIRKNYKKINIGIFEYFIKMGKFGSPCKKLYEISLQINPMFANNLKKILEKWYWL